MAEGKWPYTKPVPYSDDITLEFYQNGQRHILPYQPQSEIVLLEKRMEISNPAMVQNLKNLQAQCIKEGATPEKPAVIFVVGGAHHMMTYDLAFRKDHQPGINEAFGVPSILLGNKSNHQNYDVTATKENNYRLNMAHDVQPLTPLPQPAFPSIPASALPAQPVAPHKR